MSCCGPQAAAPARASALIDLTPVGQVALLDAAQASCCAPVVQESCCAPEAKDDCCGTAAGEPAGASCGCL
nr:MAG: hypothetical protein DIU80_16450 [Chloroflexota bacterium]